MIETTVGPSDALDDRFAEQRQAYALEPFPSLASRRDRLERLEAINEGHGPAIIAAIAADFGVRSAQETRLAEMFMVRAGIRHARSHLARWMRPRRVRTPLYLRPGRSRILRQPLGVVGVISPWNYPYQLALLPVIAALAAGNRVMVKPSELTPATAVLLDELARRYFDAAELTVVNGGADVGEAFSRLKLDHLFFTGSTAVGRRIAVAAAHNLTPVTLELGGKSPAIVLGSGDEPRVARRIAAGKFLNAGQTCIAPDYVLVPEDRLSALVTALEDALRELYPAIDDNPDYTSIVSAAHVRRLETLRDDAREQGAEIRVPIAAAGGAGGRRMPPTLVVGARGGMRIMGEEIFGPLLPLETYRSLDEAIAIVNARPRPLALYAFGGGTAERALLLERTHAGGVTLDDTMWHFCNEELPFGGVGASGMGAYHGERGFLTFSHEKPVFTQARFNAAPLLYPPYGARFEKTLALLRRLAG